MMRIKVHVDDHVCIGAGQCVLAAPAVFDQREDGIVVLRDAHPDARHHAAVRKAVALCPAEAIRIDELTND